MLQLQQSPRLQLRLQKFDQNPGTLEGKTLEFKVIKLDQKRNNVVVSRRAVVEEGLRKVDLWTGRYNLAVVDFPVSPLDPFFNANSPEDLETAAFLMA